MYFFNKVMMKISKMQHLFVSLLILNADDACKPCLSQLQFLDKTENIRIVAG